jgi:tetratricopeptide (TPR) repeat protein
MQSRHEIRDRSIANYAKLYSHDNGTKAIFDHMKLLEKRATKLDPAVIIVLAVALAIRIWYLVHYRSMPEWDHLSVDNYYHHHWAQSIAGGNILGDTTYFRAPLYAYCLGALYAILGDSLWVARLFGLAVGIGSLWLTYLIARNLFNRKTALIAVSLQALCPIIVYFESEILLDSFFTLLLQIAVYRMLLWINQRTARNILWVGLSLGLSAVARPTALPLAVLVIVTLVWTVRERKPLFRQLAFFLFGLALCVLPITARNYFVASDPVLVASQGGINLYIGNHEGADGLSAVLPEPLGFNWRMAQVTSIAEQEMHRSLKPGELSSYWTGRAIDWILSNPGKSAALFVKKLYFSFADREISNNRDMAQFFSQVLFLKYNPLTFAPIFALALIGLIAACRSSNGARLILVIVVAVTLLNVLFFVNSRFRLPVIPLLIIGAAFALGRLVDSARQGHWKTFSLVILVAVCLSMVSKVNLYPLPVGTRAQAFNSQALYYYVSGDLRQAKLAAVAALAADPLFPEANLNLGNIYLRSGKVDSAAMFFEREIAAHPLRAKGYTNLASTLLTRNRIDSALSLLDRSLSAQPFDPGPNTLYLRALAARMEIGSDSLRSLVEAAILRTHGDLRLCTEAGAILIQRGDYDEAESVLRRAVASRPPAIETDDAAFDHDFPNSPGRYEQRKATACHLLSTLSRALQRYDDAITFGREALSRDSTIAEIYLNLAASYISSGELDQATALLGVARNRFPANAQIPLVSDELAKMKKGRD